MTFDTVVSKILTNKLVLNVVTILALFNMIGYISIGNNREVFLFILLALIVSLFSKNMIIILGLPLVVVNLYALKINAVEGMENNSSNLEKKEEEVVNNNLTKTGEGSNVKSDLSNLESGSTGKESFESGRRKNSANQIDNAATVDNAYDNINNVAINRDNMSGEMKNLIRHQFQSTENMRTMKIKDVF